MRRIGDDELGDGLIQAGELGVKSSKREREVEEENSAATRRQKGSGIIP